MGESTTGNSFLQVVQKAVKRSHGFNHHHHEWARGRLESLSPLPQLDETGTTEPGRDAFGLAPPDIFSNIFHFVHNYFCCKLQMLSEGI